MLPKRFTVVLEYAFKFDEWDYKAAIIDDDFGQIGDTLKGATGTQLQNV